MFCDLNVPWGPETQARLPAVLRAIEQQGYAAVALNHVVDRVPKTRCPIQRAAASSLRQYTRLTLVLGDASRDAGLTAPTAEAVLSSYDIVAVAPESERAFQAACSGPLGAGGAAFDPDIIALDLCSGRLPFAVRPGLLRLAVSRGIAFEMCYGPVVADAGARRAAVGNARMLLRYGLATRAAHGGLIVSGGVDAPWKTRSPADVANVMGLMGVAPDVARRCLSECAERVVLHAASRRHTTRAAVLPLPAASDAADSDLAADFISLK